MTHTLKIRPPGAPSIVIQPQRSQWAVLGLLRFWLATIVVCTHIPWFTPIDPLVTVIAQFSGFAAVLSFLVVSGYSIANSLSQQTNGFYQRRIIRILPLYGLAVMFTGALEWMIGGSQAPGLNIAFSYPSAYTFFCNLFLFQGFLCFPIKTNVVLWTLSVEVFFYLIAPFLYKLPNKSLLVLVACISLTLLYAYKILGWFLQLPYYSDLLLGGGAMVLGWAWIIGFWFFFYKSYRIWGVAILLSFGIFALLAQSNEDIQREPFFILTYLVTCLAITYGHQIKLAKGVEKCCLWLGNISYPLYLIHFPLLLLMFKYLGSVSSLVLYLVSLTVAAVMEHWFDRPLRLRRQASA